MVDISTAVSSDDKTVAQHPEAQNFDSMLHSTHYVLEGSLQFHDNPKPAEYSTPITTACVHAKPSAEVTDEENTYQPLLPLLRSHQNSNCSEYQTLLRHTTVQPHETPPPIPPKPKNL